MEKERTANVVFSGRARLKSVKRYFEIPKPVQLTESRCLAFNEIKGSGHVRACWCVLFHLTL